MSVKQVGHPIQNSKEIITDQTQRISESMRPMLGYLTRLIGKLEKRVRLVRQILLSCDEGLGRAPYLSCKSEVRSLNHLLALFLPSRTPVLG